MHFLIAFVCCLVAVAQGGVAPFSWDKVPIFMHCAHREGPFGSGNLEFMRRFSVITLEKDQGYDTGHYIEYEDMLAGKELHLWNRTRPVIFYLSVAHAEPHYYATKLLDEHPSWNVKDKQGTPLADTWDFTQEVVRDFFTSIVLNATQPNKKGRHWLNGVFIDSDCWPSNDPQLTPTQITALHHGIAQVFQQIMNSLQKAKVPMPLVLANCGGKCGLPALACPPAGANAMMYEYWCHDLDKPGGHPANNCVNQMREVMNLTKQHPNLTIELRGWRKDDGIDPQNTLAAYLIVAQPGVYYGFSKSWHCENDWWKSWDFQDKQLGAPKGPAKEVRPNVFSRQFKFANVTVDAVNSKTSITWTK